MFGLIRLAPYAIVAAVAVTVGWKVNGWRLEANIASLQASYAKAHAESLEAMKNREIALKKAADKIRKDKDAQIQSVNRRLNVALNELRKRPSRSDNLPNTAGTCPASTGDRLAREDAEFLTRYSTLAAEQQEFIKYCVNQYESLR